MKHILFLFFYFVINATYATEDIVGISEIKPNISVNEAQYFLGTHAVEAKHLFDLKKRNEVLVTMSYRLKNKIHAKNQSYIFQSRIDLCQIIRNMIELERGLSELSSVSVTWYKDKSIVKHRLGNLSSPDCSFDKNMESGDVLVLHYTEIH